ncbi:RAD51-associated protein 2 [Erinaceus europaeus]|uniref:RAD51-associated protein 2 n=1 Tax=Erinaceus europaeus TaxID=9365 RepID=A0ABM3X178_ERIEU|nr:RAD51-associated protein 2 [Erinaceus europaeus]
MSVSPLRQPGAASRPLAFPSSAPEDPEGPPPPGGKRLCLEDSREARWRLPVVPRLSEGEKAWDWPPPFRPLLLLSAEALFGRPQTRAGGRPSCDPGRPARGQQEPSDPPAPASPAARGGDPNLREKPRLDSRLLGEPRPASRERKSPRVPEAPARDGAEHVPAAPPPKRPRRGGPEGSTRPGLPAEGGPVVTAAAGADGKPQSGSTLSAGGPVVMAAAGADGKPQSESRSSLSAGVPVAMAAEGICRKPQSGSSLSAGVPVAMAAEGICRKPQSESRSSLSAGVPVAMAAEGICRKPQSGSSLSAGVPVAMAAEGICRKPQSESRSSLSAGVPVAMAAEGICRKPQSGSSLSAGVPVAMAAEGICRKPQSGSTLRAGRTGALSAQLRSPGKARDSSWVSRGLSVTHRHVKHTRDRWTLPPFLGIHLFREGDDEVARAVGRCKAHSASLVIETLGSPKAFMVAFWFTGREENSRCVLPWRVQEAQKDFPVGSHLESFLMDCFHGSRSVVSGNPNNQTVTWCAILICEEQSDVQSKQNIRMILNEEQKSMDVHRKNDFPSMCLQTMVSGLSSSILKTNRAYLLNDFDSLTCVINNSKLEERSIFEWTVCLNYSKNIGENCTVHLVKTFIFSKPLGTMRLTLEETSLLKNEQVLSEPEKGNLSFFNMAMQDYLPSLETYDKISLSKEFDDRDEISLTEKVSYKNNSCPEKVAIMENGTHYSLSMAKTYVKPGSQLIQSNYRHSNEKVHEIKMYTQDVDTRRKGEHDKIRSFNFQGLFDHFNTRQQAILRSHTTKHREHTTSTSITQGLNFRNLISEIEEEHDLILKEETKAREQNLTNSCNVHKDVQLGKEEKNNLYPVACLLSVQPASFMRKKGHVEEMNKYVNQNSIAEKNEHQSILQESDLANSKHFHPKNDSTESVNHQFETDLSVANKECFQDLTAKCLSTEALTMGKDFEMKSQFDLVLEELHMFHEISRENEILDTVETIKGQENYAGENSDAEEVQRKTESDLKVGPVNQVCASSLHCDSIASLNRPRKHQSLFKWESTVPQNVEQDVPNKSHSTRISEGELLYSTKEDGEKPLPKGPAYYADELNEENFNYVLKGGSNFSHGIARVLPLKTCSRPIRVGLSRKAKLTQLHPYLK